MFRLETCVSWNAFFCFVMLNNEFIPLLLLCQVKFNEVTSATDLIQSESTASEVSSEFFYLLFGLYLLPEMKPRQSKDVIKRTLSQMWVIEGYLVAPYTPNKQQWSIMRQPSFVSCSQLKVLQFLSHFHFMLAFFYYKAWARVEL